MTAARSDRSPRSRRQAGQQFSRAARNTEDDRAVAASAAGDPEGLMRLVVGHGPACLAMARQVLQAEDMAQDAVQEAYLELWRDSSLFDPRHSLVGPWLVALTHRHAVARVRSDRQRQRPTRQSPSPPNDFDIEERTTAPLHEQTNKLLQGLPGRQRECLVLAYWGGYTLPEVSQLLDIPVETVVTQCRAAVGGLRVLLGEQGLDQRLNPSRGTSAMGVTGR